MKKTFKCYLSIWIMLFVLFNIISFVSVSIFGQEKYTFSFWSGYVLITVTFIGQFVCTYFALKSDDNKKTFYNISIIAISYSGLAISFIVGGLCMVISSWPYWIGVVLCAGVLVFNVSAILKAVATVELVNNVDNTIKRQTFFIKSLTIEVEGLIIRAKNDDIKKVCEELYQIVRYSDPMSNDVLFSIENEITINFSKLTHFVLENNSEQTNKIAHELMILLDDRNKKCRLLK